MAESVPLPATAALTSLRWEHWLVARVSVLAEIGHLLLNINLFSALQLGVSPYAEFKGHSAAIPWSIVTRPE